MKLREAAHLTRDPIVTLGGAFITSPDRAAEESRLGLADMSLYVRGRSAVLGDPPPAVVTAVFGIFPHWLIELMLNDSAVTVSAPTAIDAYSRACWAWGVRALADVEQADDAADMLYRIADDADLTGLALAAGWRQQARPRHPAQRLAHALMLVREIRGGLHFAALRACGLGVPEAAVTDPQGGRDRLLRTGWSPEDADALVAGAKARDDLHARWHRVEQLTDEAFADMMQSLHRTEAIRLTELLTGMTPTGG